LNRAQQLVFLTKEFSKVNLAEPATSQLINLTSVIFPPSPSRDVGREAHKTTKI